MSNKVAEVANQLSDFVNGSSFLKDDFADTVLKDHRYLQQETFMLFLKCVEKWSKLELHQYDDRNNYTVNASKVIIKALKDNDLY